ncbi:MAG: GTP pyrophosphokinase family protein [Clostridiales bacterium]|jgi:putative GTP pyrophosphokinase|nr:GTP pyrophosphokinase family protein [Clostridiales bacterium]
MINWDEMLLPYEQAVSELSVKFRSLAAGYGALGMASPIELVAQRVKHPSSILAKAKRKNIPWDELEDQLEDIAGIRIICRFLEDIDEVVRLIKLREGMDMTIKTERDYLKNAKPSGYKSYHMIVIYPVMCALGRKNVTCEIQIRTMAMNYWSIIEHDLQYKHDGKIPLPIRERLLYCAIKSDEMDRQFSLIHEESGIGGEDISVSKPVLVDALIKNIRILQRSGKTAEAGQYNMKLIDMYDTGDLQDFAEMIEETNALINGLL